MPLLGLRAFGAASSFAMIDFTGRLFLTERSMSAGASFLKQFGVRVKAGLVLAPLLTILLVWSPMTQAAPESVDMDTLKSAFLFNFARFIEWPVNHQESGANKRFFCFYRADDLARVFAGMTEGAWLGARQVMVRRVAQPADVEQCDLLFSSGLKPPVGSTREGLLTVGDGAAFVENGGVIALIFYRQNLRFKVNRRAASDAKLIFSSQLLKLAVVLENEVADE